MNSNRIGKHLEGSGPDSIRRIIPALYWTEVPGYKTRIINYCSEHVWIIIWTKQANLMAKINSNAVRRFSYRWKHIFWAVSLCKVIGGYQRAAAINSAECGNSTLLLQPPTRLHGCVMQKAVLTIPFLNSTWPTWYPVNQPLQSLASRRGGPVWSQSSWCGICGEQDCSVQVILRTLRF